MTTNEVAQTETGLINRCKRINEILGEALGITIEITSQHYDESKVAEIPDAADLTSDLLSWIRVIALKANNLVTQLERMKEQF